MRIGAVMNAVGEAELIGPAIAHLRRIGVGFVVLGYLDEDESLIAALAPHRGAPDLRIVSLGSKYAQTSTDRLSPLLARLIEAYPAERVLFLDPDEFWLPASGDLRNTALLAEAAVLSVPRYNIAPVAGRRLLPKILTPARYEEVLLVAQPVDAGAGRHGGEMPAPWIMTACAPKVMVDPDVVQALATGGHAPAARSLRAAAREPQDVVIAHLAISTRARFFEKLANIDETLRLHGDKFTGTDAWHWRRWQAILQAGGAEEEFRAQWMEEAALAACLADGTVQSAAALLAQRGAAEQRARAEETDRPERMRREFRRLLQAHELLQRGRAVEARPRTKSAAPLAMLLRRAAEGAALAAAGETAAARALFAEIAAAPYAPPGALLAAGRFFLEIGDAQAALGCFARRLLAGCDDSAELPRLLRPGTPGEVELLKRAFDRGGGRDLALLHRIKKRLGAGGLEGAELAAAYAALLGEPAAELALLPLAGLSEHARRVGWLHEEQAAEPWTLLPPAAPGMPAPPSQTQPGRSLFVATLPDAVVRGRSTLIECGGAALLDIQGSERVLVQTDLRLEPQVVESREDRVTLLEFQREMLALPEAITLLSSAPFDLGQFVTGMVPRLLLSARAGAAFDAPVLVDDGLPERLREALDLFNVESRPVLPLPVFAAVRVGKLWAGSGWSYAPILPGRLDEATPWERLVSAPAAAAELLRGAAARAALPPDPGMRRILLLPPAGARPRLVNQEEVAAVARQAGFLPLGADTPFAAQLAALRGAEAVLAPAGPSMLLALFAPPGARVLLLGNRHTRWLAPQAALIAAGGAQVSLLAGAVTEEHPAQLHLGEYAVEMAGLRAWLDGR